MPPAVVINPQTMPRRSGLPRPVRLPSSLRASANPMEMPAPTLAASPTRKAGPECWIANAAAKRGASVDLKHEHPALGLILFFPGFGGKKFLLQRFGQLDVFSFRLGQVHEQLPGGRIGYFFG